MAISLHTPDVRDLPEAIAAVRDWQHEGPPFQLHSGDLGWFWQFGAEATAAAVRTWTKDDTIVAVGLLDGAQLMRMTMAPQLHGDNELARKLHDDLIRPERGVLKEGTAYVEAPTGSLIQDLLVESGWQHDVPWTPLRRDLSAPVEDPGLRIEIVDPDRVADRCAVHRASFDGSTFGEERWQALESGPAYADARSLVGYDDQDNAVAMVTVWSAGPGKPGLLEPLGVHRDHRGKGHGRAISLAAGAALQEMGSSSATVCTPSSNVGGVRTYEAAGFVAWPEVRDRRRDG